MVTDHVLPGLTSDFVHRVPELNPGVPIMVSSGMWEAAEEYKDPNIIFLRKPCPPQILSRHLRPVSETEIWIETNEYSSPCLQEQPEHRPHRLQQEPG